MTDRPARRLRRRRRPHPHRQVRRRPRRRPPRRPRRARRPRAGRPYARPRPGPHRRRLLRQRQRRGRGQPRRRPAWPCCWPGCPSPCPASTVNRLCGSGLEAVIQAARAIARRRRLHRRRGRRRVDDPRALGAARSPNAPSPPGTSEMYSTTLGWRMVNPRMPAEWTVALGEGAELIADKHGITREAAGRLRARQPPEGGRGAWTDGLYDAEVVPVPTARTWSRGRVHPRHHAPWRRWPS